jgi:ABC-type sugar transport system permease subunit
MALYGLSVFLETPKELRKGRRSYIVLSFTLTILSALASSLDIAWFFNQVFGASSAIGFFENMGIMSWDRIASTEAWGAVIFLGDFLLVSASTK